MIFYFCLVFFLTICSVSCFNMLLLYIQDAICYLTNTYYGACYTISTVLGLFFDSFGYKSSLKNRFASVYSTETTHRLARKNLHKNSTKSNPMSSLILLENAGYKNSSIKLLNARTKKLNLLDTFGTNSLGSINYLPMFGKDYDSINNLARRLAKDTSLFEPTMRYLSYLDYALRYPERGLLEYNLIQPETTRNIYYFNGEEVIGNIY